MKRNVKEEVVRQFWKSIYVLLRDRYAIKGGIVIPNFCTIKPNVLAIEKRKEDPTKSESYRSFLEDWGENVNRMKRKNPVKTDIEVLDMDEVLVKYGSLEGWYKNPEGKYERRLKRTKKRKSDDV